MYNKQDLENIIQELFSDAADRGYTQEETEEMLDGINIDTLLQEIRHNAETVYAYRTDTKCEIGLNYRGEELFSQRATLLYEDIHDAVSDVAFVFRSTELWLLEDMRIAVVSCVSIVAGDDELVSEYTRNKYNLKFINYGTEVTGKGGDFYYQQDISGTKFTPEYPATLEKDAYVFEGWYDNPFFNESGKFNFTGATMPAGPVILYAHWVPKTHNVEVYKTSDMKAEDKIGETQVVPHRDLATEPATPTHPASDKYEFVGWFYLTDDPTPVEKAFDFSMPITRDMKIYAKWSSNVMVDYGYLKAPDDCHQLIVDPIAAPVVRQMFQWASEGAGLNTIAVRLNEAGYLPPSHYKKAQGTITHENLLGNGRWQTRTVTKILRSEVYTGDLVQGQSKTVDHQQVRADQEEWTVVRDTHEAIISHELFDTVQQLLDATAQKSKEREVKAYTPNILKGKVFCAHCGGSLHRQRNIRKKSDDVYMFHCLTRSRVSKDDCPGATIREDVLLDALADVLQGALGTALGRYSISLVELPQQAAERSEMRDKITNRKQEIQRLHGLVRSLYENLITGVLTKDEYFSYKEKYEARIGELAQEVAQLEKGLKTLDKQLEQYRALAKDAENLRQDRELTAALIDRLIDRIEISTDKQIAVRFRFQSEFDDCEEVLSQCKNM